MSATIIGVLSNKGGVGKTHLATSMAIALAQRGKRVLLIDADWSSANVTRKLGVTPPRTMGDFFEGTCGLGDLIAQVPNHPNLFLMAGSTGDFAIANMDPERKRRLLIAFREIAARAHAGYIFFDLGAGVESRTLDAALAADIPLVVTTPHDVLSGYGCLKALFFRHLELAAEPPEWFAPGAFQPRVIINQVLEPGQGRAVASTMHNLLLDYARTRALNDPAVSRQFQALATDPSPPIQAMAEEIGKLGRAHAALAASALLESKCDVRLLGEVPYARELFISAEMHHTPFLLAYPNHPASEAIRALAARLTGAPPPVAQPGMNFWKRLTSLARN